MPNDSGRCDCNASDMCPLGRALSANRCTAEELRRALMQRLPVIGKPAPPTAPIPMLLHCPMCSDRHIDRGEFATKPHHTHACQNCGHCWRPAIVPTVGVQFLPGFKD